MPSILEVAQHLMTADVPVLFLDTCILLDIVRSVKRQNSKCIFQASVLRSAVTETPPRCQIVVSSIVKHEWGTHESGILEEATKHLVEMEEHSSHFHDACQALGIPIAFARGTYSAHRLPDQLHELAVQLLGATSEVIGDGECRDKALQRILFNTPPSKKSGEAKDCNILEEYLAVCRQLRAMGFTKKLVFCSSNTRDYGESGGLHPQLIPDFSPVALHFTSNLPWAVHELLT